MLKNQKVTFEINFRAYYKIILDSKTTFKILLGSKNHNDDLESKNFNKFS